ncbi:MAG: HEPN domain-containing protein [Minisyncoccales bacterium]
MQRNKLNIKKVINYWIKSSEYDFETAKFLFRGKRYSECLFFCHLMIEKTLKALAVKTIKTHAPYTHQLVDLAKIAKIDLGEEQIDYLTEITEFNIAARYDAYKFDFYKRCTKSYTEKYFKISKNLYLWLKKQL